MDDLVLKRTHWKKMRDHAVSSAPGEACGLVAGRGNLVSKVYPVENIAQHDTQFVMDPKQQIEILNKIAETHQELLAIYHSHPTGTAYPSSIDIQSYAYPGVVYIIWSKMGEKWIAKVFEIKSDFYKEIRLIIM
jgi:[CysO sulfur-carrier protein]-S-L-cysteine hydrolase